MTVHSFACSKLPRQNMMNDVRLFSRVLVLGNNIVHRQETIDTTVPSPHGVMSYVSFIKSAIGTNRTCYRMLYDVKETRLKGWKP